jgi:hypothetical protein
MKKDPADVVTTKIPTSSLRLLRLIAATMEEKQYETLGRLVEAEAKRLKLKPLKQDAP